MEKSGFEPLPSRLSEELAVLEAMADSDIDTGDIAEVVDWSGADRGRFYRTVKPFRPA
jgi:hypothetical protein